MLGALAISSASYAATFDTVGGIPNGKNGYIQSTSPKVSRTHVQAGAFEMSTPNGELDDFIAFCIDIEHTFGSPGKYSIADGPSSLVPEISTSIANSVQALFNTSFSTLDLDNANQSAGFQLALWEVLFEDENKNWNLNWGNFKVSGFNSGVTDAAREFLTITRNYLDTEIEGDGYVNYKLTWLQAEDGGQNLVTAVAVSPIPLPAAGPMLIFSLAGLGYLARRRKQAEA